MSMLGGCNGPVPSMIMHSQLVEKRVHPCDTLGLSLACTGKEQDKTFADRAAPTHW